MHRLFVGLRPPLAIRQRLLTTMSGVNGARWQDDGQLHVTLRFVGEVDGNVAEDIAAILETVHASPLAMTIAGVGSFDRKGRANSLWAGVGPREPLLSLHRKVDHALARAGQPPDTRAYHPHVTLARLNVPQESVAPWVSAHAALATPPFAADAFYLFESHLGRDGARYEAIARYRMGA